MSVVRRNDRRHELSGNVGTPFDGGVLRAR